MSVSYSGPFAFPFFHQHGLPRENQTPAALQAQPAHRCPVTNQLSPTAAGAGRGRMAGSGVEGQDGNWSWEGVPERGRSQGARPFCIPNSKGRLCFWLVAKAGDSW